MDHDKKWEDLNLSNDELKRISEALKKEEFRKLLVEYAEEISDPENRKKYEEEISQLENERGMDVKFVNPEPGYVIKTASDGTCKTFINVCKNEHIEKPKCVKKTGPDGKPGHQWSIPHSFAPVRDDNDKSGSKCKVIDFVVHHDTYRMAESNFQFKKMLHDTAFEGIERQFGMKIDKKNVKLPKLNFKGTPTATVIRTKKDETSESKLDPDDPLSKVPYPYDKTNPEPKPPANNPKQNDRVQKTNTESSDGYEIPKYSFIHRGFFDIQDFREAPDAKQSTRPKELIVEIQLPLLKSAASVDLDVLPKKINLQSEKPAKYKLSLDLPYEVDEDNGSAKFDKSKHKLVVTLPVIPPKIESVSFGIDDQSNGASTDDIMDLKMPSDGPVDGKPLIEVIASKENGVDEPSVDAAGDCKADESVPAEPLTNGTHQPGLATQKPKYYAFPAYDYLQDDEAVTIILDVKNAVRESIDKHFIVHDSKCIGLDIKMMSMGTGGFPMHYQCAVRFDSTCIVDAEHSYVDVGPHNVVVTLLKADSCLGHWDTFRIGSQEEHLQVCSHTTQML